MEAFDPHPSSTTKAIELDTEINEVIIGGKSKSQTLPFLLTFEIFNHNVHNCLVDSGASSNVFFLTETIKGFNSKHVVHNHSLQKNNI